MWSFSIVLPAAAQEYGSTAEIWLMTSVHADTVQKQVNLRFADDKSKACQRQCLAQSFMQSLACTKDGRPLGLTH